MNSVFLKLMRAYRYVYYKLYRWSEKVNPGEFYHEISAVVMISVTIGMNLLVMLIPILLTFNLKWPEGKGVPLLLAGIIGVANYFIFIRRERHKKIIKEFYKEGTIKRKRGNFLVACYVTGSPLLLIGLMFVGVWLRNTG